MPFNRYVGAKVEASFGAGATTYDKFYRVASESIEPTREYEYDEDLATGYDVQLAALGAQGAEGGLELYLNPGDIGHFLLGLAGAKTTTGLGSPVVAYEHVFTPADTLPSLALIVGRDIDAEMIKGAIVDSMSFEFDATAARIPVSVEIVAREALSGSHVTPTFATTRDFASSDTITVTVGGVSKKPRTLSFEINNNIADDFRLLGDAGRLSRVVRGGKREITGEIELYFDSITEYNDFLSGAFKGLTISVEDGQIGSSNYNYKIIFDFPRVIFEEVDVEVSGAEPIFATLSFRALKPSTGDIFTITLRNDQSDYT